MRALSLGIRKAPWWIAVGLGLTLPGCPMTDDYFIAGAGGNAPGNAATGGSAAGNTAVGGATMGGSTSLASCSSATCFGNCCGIACVDLTSDPSHCGACTTTCSGGKACAGGLCASGWTNLAPPPIGFVAREKAAYAAFGDKLFVFGGADANGNALGDGAVYDPVTNRWRLVSVDVNTPRARRLATAVWTGKLILVCGGRADDAAVAYLDGAAYDPQSDQWTTIANSPTGRVAPIGFSSATQAAFWGGWGTASTLLSGDDRIDMTTNTWQSGLPTGDPGIIDGPAWAFTGQYLYMFGGRLGGTTKSSQAWSFNLASNSWSNLAAITGPSLISARWGAFGTWDGAAFYVWGGRDETSAKNNGQFYSGGFWTASVQQGAPSGRWVPYRQSGWAFARAAGDLLFLGGQDFADKFLTDGARYNTGLGATAASWSPIPAWKSGEAHQWGVAAYVGGAVIVWGGRNGTVLTTTGDRWAP